MSVYSSGGIVACPFFMPGERFEAIPLPHRARLPLGDGWKGLCTAPGHENSVPDDRELTDFCNLGYAKCCPHLPQDRAADAIRFSVARDREGSVLLFYICEADHRPGEHGTVEYDCASRGWRSQHRDARIQRMAECYLEVYLQRRHRPILESTPLSPLPEIPGNNPA